MVWGVYPYYTSDVMKYFSFLRFRGPLLYTQCLLSTGFVEHDTPHVFSFQKAHGLDSDKYTLPKLQIVPVPHMMILGMLSPLKHASTLRRFKAGSFFCFTFFRLQTKPPKTTFEV